MPAVPLLSRRRRLAVIVGALSTVAVTSAGGAVASATAGADTVQLTGQVVHDLASYTDLGAVPASTPMRVGVQLKTDTGAIDRAYTAMMTPGSPSYQQYLTPAQYREHFGVAATAAAAARDAVTAKGLSVVYAAPDGSYLELTGSTAQVEQTFQVTEHRYRGAVAGSRGETTFTATPQAATVPSSIAAVAGLSSLSDKHTAAHATRPLVAPGQDLCLPGRCTGTLTPNDLWSIYDQPNGDMGQGQKVGIFGEGMVDDVVANLRKFEAAEKLPDGTAFPVVPTRQVLVGDDLTDDAGVGEWDLDSDASTGMSPKLQELDYYFGSDLSDASIGGTYSAWANEDSSTAPMTGNSSFGGAEALEYTGGFILDAPLRQAAMEGRTMFASSGDGGGSCLPGANGVTNDGVPCVEYPSSSPYVTGVGGTVIYAATTTATSSTQATPAARSLEYAWTYSGGGQSEFEPAPAYQTKVFPAGAAVPCAAGPSVGKSCRGVPDISSLSGDFTTGYQVYSGGSLSSSGGTSLSSPLWAGMWARVLAAHASTCTTPYSGVQQGRSVGGFAQSALYGLANTSLAEDTADFFDVGGATNSQPSGNGQQMAIPRTPVVDPTGYDYVTGLGAPVLSHIIGTLDCGNSTPVAANTVPASTDTTVVPTLSGCGINGVLTPSRPAGDELPPTDTALDIINAAVTSDVSAQTTTFAVQVTDLAGTPASGTDYAFDFKYANVAYAVAADRGATNSFTLYKRNVTDVEVNNLEQPPTSLSAALTGTYDTAKNTLSITMPWSVFNSAAKPSAPFGRGSVVSVITIYTNVGTAATAFPLNYNGNPVDQAEYYQCSYQVPSVATPTAPPAALPEAPDAALLLLAAVPVGAVLLARRRRRATA